MASERQQPHSPFVSVLVRQQQQTASAPLILQPLAFVYGAVAVVHAAPATAEVLEPLALVPFDSVCAVEKGAVALRARTAMASEGTVQ